MTITLILTLITTQFAKVGDQSSQTVQLLKQQDYYYDAKESLPLIFIVYFYVDEVFDRIRSYQERNPNSEFKHPDGRLLEKDFYKWTDGDRAFFKWYSCKHTKVFY